MKRIQFLFIAAAMLCATACDKIDKTDPIDTPQNCVIVYTVDNQESRTTVKSESDWDRLLDQFCNYAQEGKSVMFYNLSSQPNDLYSGKSFMPAKEGTTPTTITTTSREELKTWMRKMEQSGKTVNVTYNQQTGVWNGRAYANAGVTTDTTAYAVYHGVITSFTLTGLYIPSMPSMNVLALYVNADTTLLLARDYYLIEAGRGLDGYQIGDSVTLCGKLMTIENLGDTSLLVLNITSNNPATVVGSWHYTCLTEYVQEGGHNYLDVVTQYIPEENGNSIYYNFYSDGTATRTVGSATTPSESGSWSLSDDQFCCDLSGMNDDCWNIVWLTTTSMIISRIDNEDGVVLYQMMLEKTSR